MSTGNSSGTQKTLFERHVHSMTLDSAEQAADLMVAVTRGAKRPCPSPQPRLRPGEPHVLLDEVTKGNPPVSINKEDSKRFLKAVDALSNVTTAKTKLANEVVHCSAENPCHPRPQDRYLL